MREQICQTCTYSPAVMQNRFIKCTWYLLLMLINATYFIRSNALLSIFSHNGQRVRSMGQDGLFQFLAEPYN